MSILDAKPNKAPTSALPELSKEQRASIATRYPLRMKAESNAFSVSETRYPGVGGLVSQKLAAEQAPAPAPEQADPDMATPGAAALGRRAVSTEASLPAPPSSLAEPAALQPIATPVESAQAAQAPNAPEQSQPTSPAPASVHSARSGAQLLDIEAIRASVAAATQGQTAA